MNKKSKLEVSHDLTTRRSSLLFLTLVVLGCVSLSPVAAQQQARLKHPYERTSLKPEPVLFGEGVISTADDELNSAFTPDGKTLYYSLNGPGGLRLGVILVSHFIRGRWSTPAVADFSGQYTDYDPFISPDGSRLFFISNRPVEGKPRKDFDIWMVVKSGDGWTTPVNLGAPINTTSQEFYPSVAANGTLYFSSTREGGKGSGDIYRSRFVDGKYTEPENLGDAINSKVFDGDPYIAPDESYLIFPSYGRPDDLGGGDLYISFNRNGAWTPARNLGNKINSSAREYCPAVSPDGKYFFFTSFRSFLDSPLDRRLTYKELEGKLKSAQNGVGNIYQVDINSLGTDKTSGGDL